MGSRRLHSLLVLVVLASTCTHTDDAVAVAITAVRSLWSAW